jgi:tryptophan-rich sensory protein
MNQLASSRQLRGSFMRWALVLVPIVLLVGFISGQLAYGDPDNSWFAALHKPALFPSPEIFSIAWSIPYVLMGLALALVAAARGASGRGIAIAVFLVQLLLNLAWTPLFFGLHEIRSALILLVVLDVAILLTVVLFARVRPRAALLLVPYLAWALFATLLNWQFLQANPNADGLAGSGAVTRVEI